MAIFLMTKSIEVIVIDVNLKQWAQSNVARRLLLGEAAFIAFQDENSFSFSFEEQLFCTHEII